MNQPIRVFIFFIFLFALVTPDCLLAKHPRRTTVGRLSLYLGSIKALVSEYGEQLKPKLEYSYPLVQQLEFYGEHRAMVAINGIGTAFIPEEFGFEIKIKFSQPNPTYIEF